MMDTEVIIDRQAFKLGKQIGKGGEGTVYLLGNDRKYAVKIYSAENLASREMKVSAMVSSGLATNNPLVAFPSSIARDKHGNFVGFVMRLVSDHKPLHELYAPGSRKHHFPQADYRFLVRSASNFARAVALTHKSGCIIGDINHSGILVSSKATVTLIDADSFQFSEQGNTFLCKVGVPEYTPPELQGKSLSAVQRTSNHDAFGMAVVIFQILFMGRHPFVGTVRKGEIPPLHENIQNFRYVYTDVRDVGMDQPPGTPSLIDFSPEIARLFESAFSKAGLSTRPNAEQWVHHLEKLETSLIECNQNKLHYSPAGANECAWCEMEEKLSTILFLPNYQTPISFIQGFDPGAGNFNLEGIWGQIQSLSQHIGVAPTPRYQTGHIAPSESVKIEKKSEISKTKLFLGICSVISLFILPRMWFVFIPLACIFFAKAKERRPIRAQHFEAKYISAAIEFDEAKSNWLTRIGYHDVRSLHESLSKAYQDYKYLSEEENNLKSRYKNQRRERQLQNFLDQFDIAAQQIKGIGPAKLATLASYGIDTAADISKSKLLSVPGFGEKNSEGLLSWRRKLETRFVYQAQTNDVDRQELAKIAAQIQAKAIPLRKLLVNGPKNLDSLIRRMRAAQDNQDPLVLRKAINKEQAKTDLEFLGRSLPSVVPTRPQPTRPSPVQRQAPRSRTTSPRTGNNAQQCPRCGSVMQLRTARKGRNAGNNFWGCSRYPKCKGIRNI